MPQPEQISIQHILISFDETPVKAQRTKEEAKKLAETLLQKAVEKEDFSQLVREYSDDPVQENDPQPGVYNLLNHNVEGDNFQEYMTNLNIRASEKEQDLAAKMNAGTISQETLESQMNEFIEQLRTEADHTASSLPHPRSAMVSAFGDVGFNLSLGEVGLAAFNEKSSPFGWHVIKRIK